LGVFFSLLPPFQQGLQPDEVFGSQDCAQCNWWASVWLGSCSLLLLNSFDVTPYCALWDAGLPADSPASTDSRLEQFPYRCYIMRSSRHRAPFLWT